jgi:hypothetical protein
VPKTQSGAPSSLNRSATKTLDGIYSLTGNIRECGIAAAKSGQASSAVLKYLLYLASLWPCIISSQQVPPFQPAETASPFISSFSIHFGTSDTAPYVHHRALCWNSLVKHEWEYKGMWHGGREIRLSIACRVETSSAFNMLMALRDLVTTYSTVPTCCKVFMLSFLVVLFFIFCCDF